jgi:hypothetical protein
MGISGFAAGVLILLGITATARSLESVTASPSPTAARPPQASGDAARRRPAPGA